jgi:hypothetical protein
VIAADDASRGLHSSTRVFHWPNSPGPGARGRGVGDERDHAGVDPGHQPVRLLPLESRTSRPLAPAGQIGHVLHPLIDQVPAEGIC